MSEAVEEQAPKPFTPVSDDGIARWKKMYEVLRAADIDTVVSYGALGKACGLDDFTQRQLIQSTAARAIKELSDVDKRGVIAVRDSGYRIVQPHEHLTLAKEDQRRSRKMVARGRKRLINTDRTLLDKQTAAAFDTAETALELQERFARELDIRRKPSVLHGRVSDAQKRIYGSAEPPEQTAEELAVLRSKLEDLRARVAEITAE